MNDDNNDNVIDLAAVRKSKQEDGGTSMVTKKDTRGTFEFHLFNNDETEVVTAEGYMKFGPQFLAVVEGPEDDAVVSFACQTALVRYIKKINPAGETEATLAL